VKINWFTDENRITHMQTTQKFLFENCFDLATPFEAEVEDEENLPPPPPTFSEEEVSLARAQGFAEGRTEGIAEMQTSLDNRIADLVGAMVEQLKQLDANQAVAAEAAELRLMGLAGAIAKKVVPPIVRERAQDSVEEVIRECLPKLMDEPRVVIRIHPTLMDELRAKIDTLAAKSGFAGDIILLPDDDFSEADCLIEWADGGAEKSTTDLWADIDRIMDAYLDTPEPTSGGDTPNTQPDPEPPIPAATGTEFPEENLNG
jgi:flagellar assembly protein FliH